MYSKQNMASRWEKAAGSIQGIILAHPRGAVISRATLPGRVTQPVLLKSWIEPAAMVFTIFYV
ncbi:MAG: hypothetical protein PHX05_00910 [Acidobacteriota bacterium]|jgi:hypothetical protein|nr:hypothetical protein [Acidobacteriota bacterium]